MKLPLLILSFLVCFVGLANSSNCLEPTIKIHSSQQDFDQYASRHYRLEAKVDNGQSAIVELNGTSLATYFNKKSGQLEAFANLKPGNNLIKIKALNDCGETVSELIIKTRLEPCANLPNILEQPRYVTKPARKEKTVRFQMLGDVTFKLNGNPIYSLSGFGGTYRLKLSLQEGFNRLVVKVKNDCETIQREYIFISCKPPSINHLDANIDKKNERLLVKTVVQGKDTIKLTANRQVIPYTIKDDTLFGRIRVKEGRFAVTTTAENTCGVSSKQTVVYFKRDCAEKPSISILNKKALKDGDTDLAKVTFSNPDNRAIQVLYNKRIMQNFEATTDTFTYKIYKPYDGKSTETTFVTYNKCRDKAKASVSARSKESGVGLVSAKSSNKRPKPPKQKDNCKAKKPYITLFNYPSTAIAPGTVQTIRFSVRALRKIYPEVINASTDEDQYIMCSHNGVVVPITLQDGVLSVPIALNKGFNKVLIEAGNTCPNNRRAELLTYNYNPCVEEIKLSSLVMSDDATITANLGKPGISPEFVTLTQNGDTISTTVYGSYAQTKVTLEDGLNRFVLTYSDTSCGTLTEEISVIKEVQCPKPSFRLFAPKSLTLGLHEYLNPIPFQVKLIDYQLSDTLDKDRSIEVRVDGMVIPHNYHKSSRLLTFTVPPKPSQKQITVKIKIKNDCCASSEVSYVISKPLPQLSSRPKPQTNPKPKPDPPVKY